MDQYGNQELQIDIEQQTSKYKQNKIVEEHYNVPVFTDRMEEYGIPVKFGVFFLIQIGLHRRASFEVLYGIMHPVASTLPEGGDYQYTADLIAGMLVAGFVDYEPLSEDFVCVFSIPAQMQEKLASLQYPIPMICKPRKLNCNKHDGYLTGSKSVLLKGYNHHDDDVNLDLINRLNGIKFTLNHTVGNLIRNQWKDLDKKKPDEFVDEYIDRVASFLRYEENSKEVMQLMAMSGDEFYFTHRYDKRGRVYCQGYHINYQGNSWNKAVVEFANKELVE